MQQRNVAIILVPEFTLMDLAAAVEPLQRANLVSEQDVYQCDFYSEHGGPVASSCGLSAETESLRCLDHKSAAFAIVCAGANAEQYASSLVSSHLVRLHRHGVPVGGVSGGSFVLASAGLLSGRSCSLIDHHEEAFARRFPGIAISSSIITCFGDVFTCSGGTATLDLMLHAIADDHGRSFSNRVSDQLSHGTARDQATPRRLPPADRYGTHDRLVTQALALMEDSCEEPIAPADIASRLDVPLRRMERRFKCELGLAPITVYTQIRLRKAERLLTQTDQAVTEIAAACGYQSPSHFTRTFSKAYGATPTDYRLSRKRIAPRIPGHR